MSAVDPLARHKEAIALAEDILADLELNRIALANIAMKCARLARLSGDEQAQRWFRSEMGGYDLNNDLDSFWIGWEAGRAVRETRDKPDSEKKIWTGSISEMEATTDTLREELSHLDVPPMTEGSSQNEYYIPGAALKGIVDTFLQRQRNISQQIREQVGVLAEVRTAIHAWVLGCYHLLRFVDIPADAFQRAKALVDERLGVISPDALRMFGAAQERARSGAPEEWSQAALSLRRMMKEVADAFYPASDRVVNGHKLDDEHFVNRLWQFVRERAASDRSAVLSAEVEYIGRRVETLYDLACKGTHDAVTQAEVELAVVHLYLLFADLLSMLTPEEFAALSARDSQEAEVAPRSS